MLRWVLAAFAVLFALATGGAIGAFIWLRTESGQAWALARILDAASPVRGTLTADGWSTDYLSGITLRGVAIRDAGGRTIVAADTVELDYRLAGLLGRKLRIRSAKITGLEVDLVVTDGVLDIAALWDTGAPEPPSAPWDGLGIDLLVDAITVEDATVSVRTDAQAWRFDGVKLAGGVELRGDAVGLRGLTLDAATREPELGPLSLRLDGSYDPRAVRVDAIAFGLGPNRVEAAGGVLQGGDAEMGFRVTTLHVEPESLPGELPIAGVFDGTGTVGGRLDAPTFTLAAVTPGGPVTIEGALDLREARPTWSATVTAGDVAIDRFVVGVTDTRIDGTVKAEGHGLGWPDDLDGSVIFDLRAAKVQGRGPFTAAGEATLGGGAFEVTRIAATAPGGSVQGSGTVRLLDGTGDLRVERIRAHLPDLDQYGVSGLVGSVTFTGRVAADWSGAVPRVDATGVISGAEVGYGGSVLAATASGPVRVGYDAAGARFRGVLALAGVTAPQTRLDSAHVDAAGAVATDGTFTARGTFTAAGVTAGPSATVSAEGDLDVTMRPDGGLAGALHLATGPIAIERVRGDRSVALVTLDDRRASVVVDVYETDRTVAALTGEIDLDRLAMRAERLVVALSREQVWTGDGVQRLRVVDGALEDVHLALSNRDARLSVDGDADFDGELALTFGAKALSLASLGELAPALEGYRGTVELRGGLEGPASRARLSAEIDARGLLVPDAVRDLDVHLVAEGTGDALALDVSLGTGGATLATVQGTLPLSLDLSAPRLVPGGPMDLTIALPPSGTAEWNRMLGRTDLPEVRLSGALTLRGTPVAPDVTIVSAIAVKADAEWLRLDVDARSEGARLDLRVVARERFQRRAEILGSSAIHLDRVARSLLGEGPVVALSDPATWVDDLNFDVIPLQMPLTTIAAFARVPPDVSGNLLGGLHVSGSPAAPVFEGGLMVTEGKLGNLAVSPAVVEIVPAEGGYSLGIDLGFGGTGPQAGGGIGVTGFLPFSPRDAAPWEAPGLDIRIAGAGVPLAAVAALYPAIQAARGVLKLEGRVTGSVAAPIPDVRFATEGASFALYSTGVAYDAVNVSAALNDRELRVDELSLETRMMTDRRSGIVRPGTVNASLRVAHERLKFGAVKGKAVFRDALLVGQTDRMLKIAEGDITVDGTVDRLSVRGGVRMDTARLRVGERFFSGASDLALPPGVHVQRPGIVRIEEAARAAETLVPAWIRLAVQVDLARSGFLEASLPIDVGLGAITKSLTTIGVETQLDGTVTARADNGVFSLVGAVIPLRGTATVFTRPFDIQSGTISFTGLDYTNPVLDLTAVYSSAYGPITTRITGTPNAPSVTFESEDYSSPDDVLSILLIGRPASEPASSSDQTPDALVWAAAEALLKSQAATAGSLTPVDLFEVGSKNLRVGQRLGSRVFLVVDYNWAADNEETSAYEATIEVRIGKGQNLQLEIATGTAGTASMSIYRKWRF